MYGKGTISLLSPAEEALRDSEALDRFRAQQDAKEATNKTPTRPGSKKAQA
jgi:hypothetical protein